MSPILSRGGVSSPPEESFVLENVIPPLRTFYGASLLSARSLFPPLEALSSSSNHASVCDLPFVFLPEGVTRVAGFLGKKTVASQGSTFPAIYAPAPV